MDNYPVVLPHRQVAEEATNGIQFVVWYVYVLRSTKNSRLYVGYTANIKKRLLQHNSKQGGVYTSKNAPFEILFFEAFKDKRDATKAERFWKTGYGREVLKDKIKYSLE